MLKMLWPLMPASLREKFCNRIVVTGAESTGTSTLALALAEALNCPYVPEYGREYTEKRNAVSQDPWREDELVHIAEEQIELENAAAARSDNGLIIADTDAMTTGLWHERYFGEASDRVGQIVMRQTPPFAYILTSNDIPFVADDIREGGEARQRMTERFRSILTGSDIPWIEVTGSVENRMAQALAFLGELGVDKPTA